MPTDDDAARGVAAADPKRPIRPEGAPPRPGSSARTPVPPSAAVRGPDDETVVRPKPIPLPRRVLRDEPRTTAAPLVAERVTPPRPAATGHGKGASGSARTAPATAPVRALATPSDPASLPSVAAATVLTHRTIGRSAGQLDLADPRWTRGPATAVLLEARSGALPELDDDVPVTRLTRQPAFLVSVAAAIVVVAVVVVIVLMQTVFRGPDRVENLQLLDGGANYVLQWNGPNVPYAVSMTEASTGRTIDVSSLIRGGREAWIPKNGAEVTDRSCFIVRSQRESESTRLPTTASALAAQGAARVCVSQVSSN